MGIVIVGEFLLFLVNHIRSGLVAQSLMPTLLQQIGFTFGRVFCINPQEDFPPHGYLMIIRPLLVLPRPTPQKF